MTFSATKFRTPPFPVQPFSVEEYHRLIQAGVLDEEDPIELLEGWLTRKMVRNPKHDVTIELVHDALRRALPESWRVRVQSAITTADSEPEPDLSVVEGPIRKHIESHPGPEEIALVIEAADSSLDHDRIAKGRVYARARIPHFWIVKLVDSKIEVYSDPATEEGEPSYRRCEEYSASDSVPLIIAGKEIARIPVKDLLA